MIRDGFCEVLACGGFAVAFILLFFAGEYLRRVRRWPPEVTRKLIHLVGCLIAMLFPVFLSFWSVLALCTHICPERCRSIGMNSSRCARL